MTATTFLDFVPFTHGPMRPITPGLHRTLDVVTVLAFAAAPSLLGLAGLPAYVAYVLAAVHSLVTLLTAFDPTMRRPLSLALHGLIEGIVGPALILLPLVGGWNGVARDFYFAAGLVIIAVRLLTDYRTTRTPGAE